MNTLVAQIKAVVPQGVKVAAIIIFSLGIGCAAVVGFLAGVSDGRRGNLGVAAGSLVFGVVVALWLLAIGYVYADAKRRGMQAILWLAIAIIVPNLVGFILYFALREPLLSACAQCGQGVAPGQKFCPTCGREQGTNSPSSPTSGSGSVSLNHQSNGLAQKSLVSGLSVWIVIFAAKGIFSYWKHATVDAGGWLILAGICALLVVLLQQRSVLSRTSMM